MSLIAGLGKLHRFRAIVLTACFLTGASTFIKFIFSYITHGLSSLQDSLGWKLYYTLSDIQFFFNLAVYLLLLVYFVIVIFLLYKGPQKITREQLYRCLRGGWEKLGIVLVTLFLQMITTIGRTLVLVVPGVIYFVKTVFALPAVIIDDQDPEKGLQRSKVMVSGNRRKTFSMILIMCFVVTVICIVVFVGMNLLLFTIDVAAIAVIWEVLLLFFYFCVMGIGARIRASTYVGYRDNNLILDQKRIYRFFVYLFPVVVFIISIPILFTRFVMRDVGAGGIGDPQRFYLTHKTQFDNVAYQIENRSLSLSGGEVEGYTFMKYNENYYYSMITSFLENFDALVYSKSGEPPPPTFDGCIDRSARTKLDTHRYFFTCS